MSSARPVPIQLPLSSFFPPPPSSSLLAGPSQPIPSPTFLIGPIPPTAPLHLALSYLESADISPYNLQVRLPPISQLRPGDEKGKGVQRQDRDQSLHMIEDDDQGYGRPKERALIITGSKASFGDSIEEDDEDWLRSHGGDYEVLKRLGRIDMRYCPTLDHLKLLLALLSERTEHAHQPIEPHHLTKTPSVVILWDIAALFMYDVEVDENVPPVEELDLEEERSAVEVAIRERKGKRFKPSVNISDYLDILSATRAMVDHLCSLHPSYREPPTQLIFLEPNLTSTSDLPIIPAAVEVEETKLSKVNREKRIPLVDGARWLLGNQAVAIVEPYPSSEEGPQTRYSLMLDSYPGEVYQMRRRRCGRGDWAVPVVDEDTEVEGLKGGWRWEWA
ncbi:hypothetical protein IAR55_001620 [Kwoniella newhampshirensis]|uniref:Uncharacterized protein n=1 Tax=Kwoniella newhampshirensis TaxID=1651941 RepID=A0AAW0Z2M9_9TREE